jgi:hypothetical protein
VRQLRTHFGYLGRGTARMRYDVQLMPTRTSPGRTPRK